MIIVIDAAHSVIKNCIVADCSVVYVEYHAATTIKLSAIIISVVLRWL